MLAECIASRPLWPASPELEIANLLAHGSIPWPMTDLTIAPMLAKIVDQALAPDRDDRYATAEAMRADLSAQLATRDDVPSEAELGALVSEGFADERRLRREMIGRGLRSAIGNEAISSFHEEAQRPEDVTRRIPDGSSVTAAVEVGGTRATRRKPSPTVLALVGGSALAIGAWAVTRDRDEAVTSIPPAPADEAELVSPQEVESALAGPGDRSGATGRIVALTGDLENDATLRADVTYRLEHYMFVAPGVTLTIEPGTTILGDVETRGTLVIRPGGRIVADGTAEQPIVFTSSRPAAERRSGDWGGVLLLGRAPTNAHSADGRPVHGRVEGLTERGAFGGDDAKDSSGTLRWVRIEYSGVAIGPNNEINGLTLAGVGSGTTIDHVAVRRTSDDCFEFFGGTVDARHLYCESPGDDAFDWDLGYRGRLQFLFAVDMPEDSGANGIEGDNDADGTSVSPRSAPTVFNATLCGPTTGRTGERYGILARSGTAGRIEGALVIGFDAGIDVRGGNTALELERSVFVSMHADSLAFAESADEADDGPHEDDDEGFDEMARFGPRNTMRMEPSPKCTSATAGEVVVPSGEHSAVQPPDDGWFDVTATFVGAHGDGHRWLDRSGEAARWLGE